MQNKSELQEVTLLRLLSFLILLTKGSALSFNNLYNVLRGVCFFGE